MNEIKGNFFYETLVQGIRDIYRAQLRIAQNRIYQVGRERRIVLGEGRAVRERSGALLKALNNPETTVERLGDSVRAVMNYPIYIRFLDMKKRSNFKIYNRQIWGILYKETFNKMRYELSEQVRDWITGELNRIYNNNKH